MSVTANSPRRNSKASTRIDKAAPRADLKRNLTQVASQIAGEVAQGSRKTTLRRLLKRCGYERRNAATVRRLQAALDAAGVRCMPPPAGVDSLDDAIRLTPAAPKASGEPGTRRRRAAPRFASR